MLFSVQPTLFLLLCIASLGSQKQLTLPPEWKLGSSYEKHTPMGPLIDEISVESIAQLERATRQRIVAEKVYRAILADDGSTVEVILDRYGDDFARANVVGNMERLALATIMHHRLGMLRVLVAHGADIHKAYDPMRSPLLDKAVQYGFVEGASWLLEMGVRSNPLLPSPLHIAAQFGNRQMVEMLLEKGPWGVNERDGHLRWTPLHYLAGNAMHTFKPFPGRLDSMAAQRKPKNPPKNLVATYDALGTVEVLLKAGADWRLNGLPVVIGCH